MDEIKCRECGKEFAEDLSLCPHCGTPKNPDIPKYPTFGGSWVIKVMWVLFIALVVALLVSMFATQN